MKIRHKDGACLHPFEFPPPGILNAELRGGGMDTSEPFVVGHKGSGAAGTVERSQYPTPFLVYYDESLEFHSDPELAAPFVVAIRPDESGEWQIVQADADERRQLQRAGYQLEDVQPIVKVA